MILHCHRIRECQIFKRSVFEGIQNGDKVALVTFDHGIDSIYSHFKSSFKSILKTIALIVTNFLFSNEN